MDTEESADYFSIQRLLLETLETLQKAIIAFNHHYCHSRKFEEAYWQENLKLVNTTIINKELAQQITNLQPKKSPSRAQCCCQQSFMSQSTKAIEQRRCLGTPETNGERL